jgi:hypothetical protein
MQPKAFAIVKCIKAPTYDINHTTLEAMLLTRFDSLTTLRSIDLTL